MSEPARPRVVVVGAGFAGLFAVRGLKRADVDITLIDRQNYHLFQPLLYQVATAGLAPSDIAWPIRNVLSRQENATILLGEVTGIDTRERCVQTASRRLDYDYLVLATGATHAYFGNESWADHAPGLKSIDDATDIRRRILMAFERAEMMPPGPERKAMMTFVIVGAGPTGVELAGTIAELARHTLAADFRHIDSRSSRILLVEAGDRVLPAMDETSSRYAARALEKLGVQVCLGKAVTHCDGVGVHIGEEPLACATVLWAAGVAASPAGRWLDVETDRAGRVVVTDQLSVPSLERVFVIGDTARVLDLEGNQVPGIAPAAKQQGRHVAKWIRGDIEGKPLRKPFRYRHTGNLATIGRRAAVIEFPKFRLKGFLAWWVWGVAHIYFLIGVRSPLLVSCRWFWQYLTYGRGARLITGHKRKQQANRNAG